MSPGLVYACDSTSLIDLFQHFPVEFKIPEGVFRELRRKTDRLRHYLEQWEQKYQIVIRLSSDTRLLPELARIEQKMEKRYLLAA